MGEGETVVRRCKRCNIIFHIKPDEQAWWHERDLYLPSHCKDCREERRKEKESGRRQPQQRPQPTPQDIEIEVAFDADIFELHQEAMNTLSHTLTALKSSPVESLTTFADLDKIFTAAEEVVASSQLLGIIPTDPDAEEEEEEEAAEKEPLESSPQTTEAPEGQDDEVSSPSGPDSLAERFAREAGAEAGGN